MKNFFFLLILFLTLVNSGTTYAKPELSGSTGSNLKLEVQSDQGGVGYLVVSDLGLSIDFKRLKTKFLILSPKLETIVENYSSKKYLKYCRIKYIL